MPYDVVACCLLLICRCYVCFSNFDICIQCARALPVATPTPTEPTTDKPPSPAVKPVSDTIEPVSSTPVMPPLKREMSTPDRTHALAVQLTRLGYSLADCKAAVESCDHHLLHAMLSLLDNDTLLPAPFSSAFTIFPFPYQCQPPRVAEGLPRIMAFMEAYTEGYQRPDHAQRKKEKETVTPQHSGRKISCWQHMV